MIHRLRSEMGKAIVGQEEMISRLLVGLLTHGHILLEGVPGLAKTTAIKSPARALSTGFKAGVLRLLHGTVVRRRGLHHGGTENTELKMNHCNYLRLFGIQRTMYAQVVLW